MIPHSSSDLLRPFAPNPTRPFDLRLAGHLARRTGLCADLATRQRWVRAGVTAAVQQALTPGRGDDPDALFDAAVASDDVARVRAYRVWRALAGRDRLRERMALFWHGHFATSNQKVQSARLMARQLALFDAHGLGRFDALLLAVARDPAMLRWLDSDRNVKGKPNENFARELFELFALGRGAYGERDVQEAARAFTGWREQHERFLFAAGQHDDGEKQVLDARGLRDGQAVVALAAAHPRSAEFLARKWLATFVHPQPTAAEIAALAQVYTACDRDVGRTLHTLLASELFFSARAYRSRIKSPVDFAVGAVRCLGARVAPAALTRAIDQLGQVLLEPPSVEGWHEERAWLNPATWLARANFAADLAAGRRGLRLQPAPHELLRGTAEQRAAHAIELLLDGDVTPASRDALTAFAARADDAASILQAALCLPEAQLL
jgi:uncharacterized protein (DUF1800 family)